MKLGAFLLAAVILIAATAWLVLRSGRARPPIAASPNPAVVVAQDPALALDVEPSVQHSPPPRPSTDADTPPRDARRSVSPQSIVLYGWVRAAEGASFPNDPPYVSVTDDSGQRVLVTASAEGAYSISGLAPGAYRLNASARPIGQAEASLVLSLDETPLRYDVVLGEPPSVLVKVIDREGEPLRGIMLVAVATREKPGDWFDEVSGSMNNHFGIGHFAYSRDRGESLAAEYLGRLHLDVAPPVHVSLLHNQRVIATQTAGVGQKEVEFVLDSSSPLLQTGTVRVRFVDVAGGELPDANVRLEGASGARGMSWQDGAHTASRLPPGWYVLRPFAKGLAHPEIPVLVEGGVETDLGAVTLEPEQWISGTVADARGPLGSTSLRCDPFDPEAEARSSGVIMGYSVEADGKFRIGGRTRGLYLLKVDERDSGHGVWARVIDTRGGPVENVCIELVPGVPLVIRASTEDWAAVRFKVLDQSGTPFVSSRLWSKDPRSLMLAPGDYIVETRIAGARPVRKAVTLVKVPVQITLP